MVKRHFSGQSCKACRTRNYYAGFSVLVITFTCAILIQNYNGYSGAYFPGIDAYIVKGNGGYVLEVATHETGHHIWYEYLNDSQREEWNQVYLSSTQDEFVSAYARTNVREDFADTYEAAIYCVYSTDKLAFTSPKRAQLLDEFVTNNTRLIYGTGQYAVDSKE